MGRQRPQNHSVGPGIAYGWPWVRSATPPTHRPIHSQFPAFTATMGVCPVLGGMLQPKCRSRMLTPRPVPERMTGWHHVASFSESFYARSYRFFGTKNYGTRTHIAPFGYYVRSLLRLKMRLWRDKKLEIYIGIRDPPEIRERYEGRYLRNVLKRLLNPSDFRKLFFD